MRRLTSCLATLALGIALLGAGCGGDSESTVPPGASSTNAASAGVTAEARPSVVDLDGAIIPLQEFPTGWAARPPEGGDSNDAGACDLDLFRTSVDDAKADYAGAPIGVPRFTQRVGHFAPGQAATAFTSASGRALACSETKTGDTSWTVSQVSFPTLGEESLALQLTAEADGFTVVAIAVAYRVGDSIGTFVAADLGQVDTDFAVKYGKRGVARLEAVVAP